MSISWGAQYPKLKTNLRLTVNRLRMMGKKKTEMAMKARTEIADYITANKVDRARIRVEHIIREDYMVEAYELLEMYCDLLLARFGLIEQMKTLDDGIAEAVISILWAAPRIACDIAEFKTISDQLTVKYGKPFAEAARGNQLEYPAKVSPRLIQKLSVTAPPKLLVERYLILIAESAGIPFTPDPDVMREDEVAQAEKMLIDFKNAGEAVTNPAPPGQGEGYGWSVPPPSDYSEGSGGNYPPGGPGNNFPPGPPSNYNPGPPGNYPPPGPPGNNYGGGNGSGNPPPPYNGNRGGDENFYDEAEGNIYEVPSHAPQYDQVPGDYGNPAPTQGGYPAGPPPDQGAGGFKFAPIGPNGLPMGQDHSYPTLSQRNSVIENKPAGAKQPGGPSAPPQNLRKPDEDTELMFPEPPKNFSGGTGGNGGGGSGGGGGGVPGDLDFDELARRFDQLKKKS